MKPVSSRSTDQHAALYLRISSDPLDTRAGTQRQHADCLKLAGARFPDLPTRIYEDNDESAWGKKRRRPAYRSMLADLISHQLGAIIAWDQDRLLREPADLESLIDLCEKHSFTNVLTAQGDIDLTNPDGQLRARIMAAVAKKSSDDTSRRVRRAAEERALTGRWHGGPTPYGYAPDPTSPGGLVVVEGDARALRWMVDQVLDGATITSVRKRLPDTHPTARQLRSNNGVRGAVRSYVAAGLTSVGVAGRWPAILPAELHLRVRALTDEPTRDSSTITARKSWLTGVLSCGRCGTRMYTGGYTGHNGGRRRYVCKQCHRGIDAVQTEGWIERALFEATRVVRPAAASIDVDAVATEIQSIETRLQDATLMWMDGSLPREPFDTARKIAVERLVVLRSQLVREELPREAGELEARWVSMDVNQRAKAAQHALIEVVVGDATTRPRFDPERLHPRWRR